MFENTLSVSQIFIGEVFQIWKFQLFWPWSTKNIPTNAIRTNVSGASSPRTKLMWIGLNAFQSSSNTILRFASSGYPKPLLKPTVESPAEIRIKSFCKFGILFWQIAIYIFYSGFETIWFAMVCSCGFLNIEILWNFLVSCFLVHMSAWYFAFAQRLWCLKDSRHHFTYID